MRRLYFLLPDLETTHKVVDELLLARVEERHLHVIAAEGVALGDLPKASLLQKSDFIPAMERGVALGGCNRHTGRCLQHSPCQELWSLVVQCWRLVYWVPGWVHGWVA